MMESGLPAPEMTSTRASTRAKVRLDWLWNGLLIGILILGAYFRFTGLNWDQNQHLHPDERFLTMVETGIQPVTSLGQYFDTQQSSLNPNNRGYGFYVYGDLPLILVRYIGEWIGQTGYDQINLVGRQVSGFMDLGTVLMVYLIALRLYRNRLLSLLAAAFASLSVLPIQLSHYFTVDTFTNFFGMLAFYFAALLLPPLFQSSNRADAQDDVLPNGDLTKNWSSTLPYILFGAALGLAMASKINAVFLAILLPSAVAVRFFSQSSPEREQLLGLYLRNLVIAGAISVIVFRIFQPYAFSGPGFINVTPNPQWLDNLRSLASQSTGDVDFPPALQWARRPITFAFQNMEKWGLGLPLGILALAGFLWMGYRIFKGEWRQHLLIWGWTGLYFAYQSYNWTRSMRYQLLVYPTLAIIAAWAVFALWRRGQSLNWGRVWVRVGAVFVGVAVLSLTAAWAFAFTRIYTRPVTRVAASQWIYQNVPGPINLQIDSSAGSINQPVAFHSGFTLQPETPLVLAFTPRATGQLDSINFEHIGRAGNGLQTQALTVTVSDSIGGQSLAETLLEDGFGQQDDPRGKSFTASFAAPVTLKQGQTYYLQLTLPGGEPPLNLAGTVNASISTETAVITQALPEPVQALHAGERFETPFSATASGLLGEVTLDHVVDWEQRSQTKTLRAAVVDTVNAQQVLGTAEIQAAFLAGKDPRGSAYTFHFSQPVALQSGHTYLFRLDQIDGPGALAVYGSKQANESSWDDALPLGLDGYNPYDYSQGIYRSDLNFEMYWDDNPSKLQRFESVLDQADYIFISSNRQWGTTVRLPERYPLTTEYYRQLLGCPAGQEIIWCYSVAKPGMFQGGLGFELTSVFQSDPNLGSLRINDQFAEEAFTVYDHPKVLIFKKTAQYDPDKVASILGAVDLSTVVHVTPRKASAVPGNLLLPPDRLAGQTAGGTWADLFPPDAFYNQHPALAAVLWYLVIALLGWVMFPFTHLALRGLPDRGYPFARLVGILALAYGVWLLGSAKVPFSAVTISLVFAGLLLVNLVLAYTQRKSLLAELRQRGKYYLMVELFILGFFLVFLFVRLGNPDLWHPWKGGEKPMDFSYLNAVLKSTTFPPYDPWFAGGYINYYYYGFVIVGVPVKWLGITPSVAYNLILPTLYALLAAGAFSMGWNLLAATQPRRRADEPLFDLGFWERRKPFLGGLCAALALVVLGNWGTVRMIWQGIQKLSDLQGIPFEKASLLTHLGWTVTGLVKLLTIPGTRLPYGPSDWYWIPSRALPGWTITEFPAFSFLYGDPHAHLIALPITVLALAWALSILLGRWKWQGLGELFASFLLGAMAIGALKPTNTWDWPTYLALACVAVAFTALRYSHPERLLTPEISPGVKRAAIALASVAALAGLSALLYKPYSDWYGAGYNKIIPWYGERSPFWSYMTHWGAFLFVISSWMASETIDWLASTPLSALNRLRPYRRWIMLGLAALVALVLGLLFDGVVIAWLALPLMVWAGLLLLRPGLPDAKRAVLFLVGTALFLTLFVEVARLEGDLDRMNTVFKFYLQAWTLFAISAGASLVWLLPRVAYAWHPRLRNIWQPALMIIVAGTAMFPFMATMDKVNDRMAAKAPHTLDGMAYMDYAAYPENDKTMDLSQDYRAIQWMQKNVSGSPVIVEGNTPEYNWGNRFTVYTGLPGVVGWNWHQRQQRAVTPDTWVYNRVGEISDFYNTGSRSAVVSFLQRYRVRYIIVGQLEQALYSPLGLQKFADWQGSLWREVYRDGQTVIYEVQGS